MLSRCRLSCPEALAHPWMISFTPLNHRPSKSLNKLKMRRFLAKRKWKVTQLKSDMKMYSSLIAASLWWPFNPFHRPYVCHPVLFVLFFLTSRKLARLFWPYSGWLTSPAGQTLLAPPQRVRQIKRPPHNVLLCPRATCIRQMTHTSHCHFQVSPFCDQ